MSDLSDMMLSSYVSLPRYKDPGLLKEDRVQNKLNQGLSNYVSLPRYRDVRQDKWRSNLPIYDITPYRSHSEGEISKVNCGCTFGRLPVNNWMIVLWFIVIMMAIVVLGYTVMNIFSRSTSISMAEYKLVPTK
jgi:hypothetical protein